jgi:dynein heavy chain
VKVAIGQPQTLKEQIASMIVAKRFEEKEVFVKKSGSNSRLHKNLFWGLMYFHAIVTNRKDFGVAGWNAPYQFQTSDFDISCAQLSGMFGKVLGKEQEVQLKATVETLRYYYAQVNYGGRIEAAEDQAIVDAVLSDVLSERIANVERLEANMS